MLAQINSLERIIAVISTCYLFVCKMGKYTLMAFVSRVKRKKNIKRLIQSKKKFRNILFQLSIHMMETYFVKYFILHKFSFCLRMFLSMLTHQICTDGVIKVFYKPMLLIFISLINQEADNNIFIFYMITFLNMKLFYFKHICLIHITLSQRCIYIFVIALNKTCENNECPSSLIKTNSPDRK